jgi:hypothetical protein
MSNNINISGLNQNQISQISQIQNRPIQINHKKKMLIEEIKQSVDVFIKDYNNYFFEKFFSKIFGNMKNVIDEKNEKKEEIIKSYNKQINEMENLLNEGKIFFDFLFIFIKFLFIFIKFLIFLYKNLMKIIRNLLGKL